MSYTVSYCLVLFPTVSQPTTSALAAATTIYIQYPLLPPSPLHTTIQLFSLLTLQHCNSLWYLLLRPITIFIFPSPLSLFSQYNRDPTQPITPYHSPRQSQYSPKQSQYYPKQSQHHSQPYKFQLPYLDLLKQVTRIPHQRTHAKRSPASLIPPILTLPRQLGVVWNTPRTLIQQEYFSTSLYIQPF